jgi:hypothetical protein
MKSLLSITACATLAACTADISAPPIVATLPTTQPPIEVSPAVMIQAAGRPLALQLSCVAAVTEGQIATCALSKSGGNGRPITVSWSAPGADGKIALSGSTPITLSIVTQDNALVDGTRSIDVHAVVSSGTSHPQAAASITVLDNDVAPPPVVVVPPVVVPPVVTPPTPTWEPTPSLHGKPDIPSEFDPMSIVIPSALPPLLNGADLSAFRFQCSPGQLNRDDAIVYPGQHGLSHLHDYYGNLSANGDSTYESLRHGGMTTCQNPNLPAGNRSAYWNPALLNGLGFVVRPDLVTMYYKRWPTTSYHCNSEGGYPTRFYVTGSQCVGVPNGLEMIFGFNMLNPAQTPTGAVQFMCLEQLASGESMTQALNRCRSLNLPKTHLIARIEAPNCWDGKNLDSPDHRAHVAYATYGGDATGMGGWGYPRCPVTHPILMPTFTESIQYTIYAADDTSRWHYASDEMLAGAQPGSTFHSDIVTAWDPVIEKMWTVDGCLEQGRDCTAGNLGNGFGLNGTDTAWYQLSGVWTRALTWENPNRLVPVPQ